MDCLLTSQNEDSDNAVYKNYKFMWLIFNYLPLSVVLSISPKHFKKLASYNVRHKARIMLNRNTDNYNVHIPSFRLTFSIISLRHVLFSSGT